MKFVSALFVTLALLSVAPTVPAQDTRFRPERQQIPTPECLNMKGEWEGGSKPCSVKSMTHGWPTFGIGAMSAGFASATTVRATTLPSSSGRNPASSNRR